jgi:hypothetical protein
MIEEKLSDKVIYEIGYNRKKNDQYEKGLI